MFSRANHKGKWLTLVFTGVLFLSLTSAACATKETYISDEVKESVRKRIENGESVGMVIGFIDSHGKKEYSNSGTTGLDDDKPVNEFSIYEIGSISKVFTCITLADMVLNNELKLDDLAEKYLPETVKMPSRNKIEISLKHLASHSSALARIPTNMQPADPANPYADYTVENMYEFLSGYTLTRGIGGKYEYSNLGMGLLGHILSLKAGTEYEQMIIERICNVLEMESTFITFTLKLKKRLARGHNSAGEVPNWDIPTLAGAGAIRSTANDMLTFLAANMGVKRSKLSAAMDMTHRAQVDISKEMRVGLGWHIRDNGKTQIIWHNGGTGGYRTFCGFIKDKKIGVVVLSNMNISADDIGFHLLDGSYELKEIKENLAVKSDILEKYVGKYKLDKVTITIIRKGEILVADIPDQAKLALFPESETIFFMREAPVKVTFKKDESGNVSSLIFSQGGKDTEAKKIE